MKNNSIFILIVTTFLIILSIQSSAVETQFCGKEMRIEVPNIQVFSESFVDEQVVKIYNQTSPVVDVESNTYFLDGNLKKFSLDLELSSIEDSVCTYTEVGVLKSRYWVRVSGTDADAVLVIDYSQNDVFVDGQRTNVNYRMFADSNSKRPIYNFSEATLQIKTFASYRVWDTDTIKYISVGRGEIN